MPFTPIILCTAKADSKDVVAGLEAGADEYLTKPIDQMALVARVKSVLRLKQLHDQVTDMNQNLEQRVTDQLGEIERMSGLKRFLAPQIAELVLSSGGEKLLDSHRKDVTIVFCDLRGFTAFAETAEPEEVMTVLREYHDGLAGIINALEGTLERFAGDGLMVLFNDPMPCPDPCERGVKMAVADARPGRSSSPPSGRSSATISASASASRTATPRSAASAPKAASTTPPSAAW